MARRDELYLRDILEAAGHIASFLQDLDEAAFFESELHRSAVLQKLLIIGEAAARLSEEVTARRPDVPWREIVGFRNIAVHAYFTIDWQLVWRTARGEVPSLATEEQRKNNFPFSTWLDRVVSPGLNLVAMNG